MAKDEVCLLRFLGDDYISVEKATPGYLSRRKSCVGTPARRFALELQVAQNYNVRDQCEVIFRNTLELLKNHQPKKVAPILQETCTSSRVNQLPQK